MKEGYVWFILGAIIFIVGLLFSSTLNSMELASMIVGYSAMACIVCLAYGCEKLNR